MDPWFESIDVFLILYEPYFFCSAADAEYSC